MPEETRGVFAPQSTIGASRWLGAGSLALCLALPHLARAEEPVLTLDAKSFVSRFEAQNPRYAELAAHVDEQRADVTEASLLPNPSLSYQREQVFPEAGDEAENIIALGWLLDLSGRRSRRVAAARHDVRAAHARADGDRLAALTEALGAFYDAAHARLRVNALREGRAPLARMVEASRVRVKEGDAAGYDLSRLELELAGYDERLAEAATRLRAARRVLGGLLGQPRALYDADDELALPHVPADEAALVGEALAQRGDYLATAFEGSSSEAALEAAERGWVPLFNVGLGLKTAELGTESALGYFAMISVELPLFSRGQADAERARARRRESRARRRRLEREIPTEVRVAYERLAAAVEQAETFRAAQLERAQALVSKAASIYESGEGSIVELLDAYRTAVQVRLRYLTLLRRAKAAELALSRLLGRRPQLRSR